MKRYFLLWLMFLGGYAARGQQGTLDPTFSGDGWTTIHYLAGQNMGDDVARKVFVQPDGQYIAFIGGGTHVLARYQADGTLDHNFGSGGYAATHIEAYTAALQPDGKIVVAGEWYNDNLGRWQLAISRHNSNGALDLTFGESGITYTDFDPYLNTYDAALAVGSGGNIVAVLTGYYYNGSSFHYAWLAARFTSAGALDASFNPAGAVPGTRAFEFAAWAEVRSLVLQPDGKIVLAGHSEDPSLSRPVFTVARLLDDGAPDAGFGTGGWVTTAFPHEAYASSVVLQPDGKIVVGGMAAIDDGTGNQSADFALARYGDDGTPDASFGTGGMLTTGLGADEYVQALALGSEGIVVAGVRGGDDGTGNWYNDLVLARYNTSDGTLDASFNPGATVPGTLISTLAEDNAAYSVAVLSGGSIVVAGEVYNSTAQNIDYLLARYTSTGSPDNTFNTTGMVAAFYAPGMWSDIEALAVQPNGKVVAAGEGERYDPGSGYYYPVIGVARFNTDGTLDGSFGTGGVAYADIVQDPSNTRLAIRSVALAPDGKIVVGGDVERYDGSRWNYDFILARFTAAGVLDNTFNPTGTPAGVVTSDWNLEDHFSSLAVQSDGKIVAVGASNNETDNPDFFVIRYNGDGTLDNSFDTDGMVSTDFFGYGDFAVDVALQSDGKIVVSGGVENYDAGSGSYYFNFGVARYSSAGVLDNRFGSGGKALASNLYASGGAYLALQSDGKILVGGTYQNQETYVYDAALVRFTTRGTLDATFGTGGVATASFGVQEIYPGLIALQSDGKILQAGTYGIYDEGSGQWTNYLGVARYTSAGLLDNTFDNDGKLAHLLGPDTYVYDVAWQNGRLYVGGETYQPYENGAGYLAAFIAGEAPAQLPVVSITPTYSVTEGGTATLTVSISPAPAAPVVVNYATLDGSATSKGRSPDYKSARSSVTLSSTAMSADITIATNSDQVAEPGGETFSVVLSLKGKASTQATIGEGTAVVTITDATGLVNKALTVPELAEGKLAVRAFPNPTNGVFTLQLQGGTTVPATIKVTDILGREVETRTGVAANSTLQLGHNYRPGVYYIHVQQGPEKQTLKLVKGAQ